MILFCLFVITNESPKYWLYQSHHSNKQRALPKFQTPDIFQSRCRLKTNEVLEPNVTFRLYVKFGANGSS